MGVKRWLILLFVCNISNLACQRDVEIVTAVDRNYALDTGDYVFEDVEITQPAGAQYQIMRGMPERVRIRHEDNHYVMYGYAYGHHGQPYFVPCPLINELRIGPDKVIHFSAQRSVEKYSPSGMPSTSCRDLGPDTSFVIHELSYDHSRRIAGTGTRWMYSTEKDSTGKPVQVITAYRFVLSKW